MSPALDFEWALARLARHDYRARARAIAEYALRGCEHALTVYRSAVVLQHCASAVGETATRYAAEDLHHALNASPVLRASAEVQSCDLAAEWDECPEYRLSGADVDALAREHGE